VEPGKIDRKEVERHRVVELHREEVNRMVVKQVRSMVVERHKEEVHRMVVKHHKEEVHRKRHKELEHRMEEAALEHRMEEAACPRRKDLITFRLHIVGVQQVDIKDSLVTLEANLNIVEAKKVVGETMEDKLLACLQLLQV
jgi:hypothetical protein